MQGWDIVLDKLEIVKSFAANNDWQKVDESVQELQAELELFFSNDMTRLSDEERQCLISVGHELQQQVALILVRAEEAKKEVKEAAVKHNRGKRGVTAYKKI